MSSIVINAPTDKVFEAICDLTRHADWAAHPISITAEQDGPAAVGHRYSSGKSGGKLDRITITDMTPNESLAYHVVMPNGWELDWQMAVSASGDGTRVERNWQITKMPVYMAPMRLLVAAVTPIFEGKMAKKMKADLEGSA